MEQGQETQREEGEPGKAEIGPEQLPMKDGKRLHVMGQVDHPDHHCAGGQQQDLEEASNLEGQREVHGRFMGCGR